MRLRSKAAYAEDLKAGNINNSAHSEEYDDLGLAQGDNEDIDNHIVDHTSEQSENSSQPGLHTERGQGDAKMDGSTAVYCLKCLMWLVLNLLVFLAVFLVFIAPLIVKLVPTIPKHLVYLNAIKIPPNVDLSKPSSIGLNYTRSFMLNTEDDINVGVWHILPKQLEKEDLADQDFNKLLSSGHPIVVYCHGNTGTRATDHRIHLYKVLSEHGFHVLALDYRGFGDSSGIPTSEEGVATDVVQLYKWAKEKAGENTKIYVWGHSLGTGISTKAVRHLINEEKLRPEALVLESPFSNIFDAAMNHPFAYFCKMFWWFDDVFLQGMHDTGIYLQSDEHILHIDIPVLILHAEDDIVVPYRLGVKLYESSKKRPESFPPVTFYKFTKDRNFQHKWICSAPELPDILRKFMAGESVHNL